MRVVQLLPTLSFGDAVSNDAVALEKVIEEKNIQWIYGSHNGIVPGTELFFDAVTFLEDVRDGKYDYTLVDGIRIFRKNDFIAVHLSQE